MTLEQQTIQGKEPVESQDTNLEEERTSHGLLGILAALTRWLLPKVEQNINPPDSYLKELSHLWLCDYRAFLQSIILLADLERVRLEVSDEFKGLSQPQREMGLSKKTVNFLVKIYEKMLWLDEKFLERAEIEIEKGEEYMTDLDPTMVPLGFTKPSLVKISFNWSDLLTCSLASAELLANQEIQALKVEYVKLVTQQDQPGYAPQELRSIHDQMKRLPKLSEEEWTGISERFLLGFQLRTRVADAGLCFYIPVQALVDAGIIDSAESCSVSIVKQNAEFVRSFVLGAEKVCPFIGGFTSSMDFFPSAAGGQAETHLAMLMTAALGTRVLGVGASGPLIDRMRPTGEVTAEQPFGTYAYALVLMIIFRFFCLLARSGHDEDQPTSLTMLGHSMGGAALMDMAEHIPYLDLFDIVNFIFVNPALSALFSELDPNSWADIMVKIQEGHWDLGVFGPLLVQVVVPLINRIQTFIDNEFVDQVVFNLQYKFSSWFVHKAFLAGLDDNMRDLILGHVQKFTERGTEAAYTAMGAHLRARPPHDPKKLAAVMAETLAAAVTISSQGDQMVRYSAVLSMTVQASLMMASFDAESIEGSHYEFKRLFWIRMMEVLIQTMNKLRTRISGLEEGKDQWLKYDFEALQNALQQEHLIDQHDPVRHFVVASEKLLRPDQKEKIRYSRQHEFVDLFLDDYWSKMLARDRLRFREYQIAREEERRLAHSYVIARYLLQQRIKQFLDLSQDRRENHEVFFSFLKDYLVKQGINPDDYFPRLVNIEVENSDANSPQSKLGYFYSLQREDFVKFCIEYACRFGQQNVELDVLRTVRGVDCDSFLTKLELALEYKEFMGPLLKWEVEE